MANRIYLVVVSLPVKVSHDRCLYSKYLGTFELSLVQFEKASRQISYRLVVS